MKIIPNWQDKKLTCYFCRETRRVKYLFEAFDGFGEISVPCCNKCILLYSHPTEKGGAK